MKKRKRTKEQDEGERNKGENGTNNIFCIYDF